MLTNQAAEYVYEKLDELKVGPSANFYGRLVQFKPPRPTRGVGTTSSILRAILNSCRLHNVAGCD